jgi:hypothetical protein
MLSAGITPLQESPREAPAWSSLDRFSAHGTLVYEHPLAFEEASTSATTAKAAAQLMFVTGGE